MSTLAIYPGTFDPVTKGHADVIMRAAKLFPQLIVAVALSARKQPYSSLDKRLQMVKTVCDSLSNVQVMSYEGLSINFAEQQQASCLIRGVRGVADLQLELELANMNRTMHADIETVWLPARAQYTTVSASLIREIHSMGGDVSAFVDDAVIALMG